MADDLRIRNCAGVIYWHITRGASDDHAIAAAQERHPELTDADIRHAWQWAQAMQRLGRTLVCPACGGRWIKRMGELAKCENCGMRPGKRKIGQVMDDLGIPTRMEE